MADIILLHKSRTRILPDMELVVNINNNISFHFRLFPEKTNGKNFFEKSKIPILGSFWELFAQIWAKMNFLGKTGRVSF